MAIADAHGLPIALHLASASAHEVTLVSSTVAARLVSPKPQRLIGDKAYDSDPLDAQLAQVGIELIAPHRTNRKSAATQDQRALRRYRKRWKVERLFSWLFSFRRLVVRYEYYLENFLGFVYLACLLIFLRYL